MVQRGKGVEQRVRLVRQSVKDFKRTERRPETHYFAKLFESASTNQKQAPIDVGRLLAVLPLARLSFLLRDMSEPGQ